MDAVKINAEISGFILAGGKSKRMGTDKALLKIQNEPLLKRILDLINPFCDSIKISGNNIGYADFGAPIISDSFMGCGPIAGIYSCLLHSSTEWNLILGVDLPFLNVELIEYLISGVGDFDCIIPKHNSGIEPLAGLYHVRILPEVEKMIQSGDYKLMNMLGKLNTRYLDCAYLVEKYPRLFTNLNRPEDYHSI